jgi:hypothetical protein
MKRIRIQKVVILSFLFSSALFADIHDRIEYKLNRVLKDVEIIINGNTINCMPITQNMINLAGGTYTITTSGNWCLDSNVVGSIIIAADSVCFDLSCHEIDATGHARAIFVNGKDTIKISGGTILNSTSAGIEIVDCEDVTVSSINFINNNDISLYVHSTSIGACPSFTVAGASQGILVAGCDVSGCDRAMLFNGCNDLNVASCNVYDNSNTVANAVVAVEFCNDVVFQDVHVDNNVKAISGQGTGALGMFGPETAVMLVQASNNVQVKNCTTNNNTCDIVGMMTGLQVTGIVLAPDCDPITGLSSGIVIEGHQAIGNSNTTGLNLGIATFYVPGIVVSDSQTNGNVTMQSTSNQGAFLTQGFTMGFGSFGCPGLYIKKHQSNNNMSLNSVTDNGGEAYGIFIAAADADHLGNGVVIEDCQANNNGNADQGSKSSGISLNYGPAAVASSGAIVRGCQANGNAAISCVCAFGCYWNNVQYENCQADNNASFGAPDPANNSASGYGVGFAVAGDVSDIRFISCSASNNSCEIDIAAGFDASSYPPYIPEMAPLLLAFSPVNVIFEDCVAHNNNSAESFGCGFRAFGVNNCVIQDSDAFSNITSGTGSGFGVLFDTCTDSKIIRSQVHENNTHGVELLGANSSIAIIECIAMGNGQTGFDINAASTMSLGLIQDCRAMNNVLNGFANLASPLQTTFIGNLGEGNGQDFFIIGGVISLFELHWGTGLMVNLTGEPTISNWINISVAP